MIKRPNHNNLNLVLFRSIFRTLQLAALQIAKGSNKLLALGFKVK